MHASYLSPSCQDVKSIQLAFIQNDEHLQVVHGAPSSLKPIAKPFKRLDQSFPAWLCRSFKLIDLLVGLLQDLLDGWTDVVGTDNVKERKSLSLTEAYAGVRLHYLL